MRVIALRADPSMAAALNMTTDWEVAYATDPEEVPEILGDSRVVLIGGGTEEGLRLAESIRSLGVTIPAVVVGDSPAPQTARHPVLTPPFTLDELHRVVEQATSAAMQSVPPSAPKFEPVWSTEDVTVAPTEEQPAPRHLEVVPPAPPQRAEPIAAPVATSAAPQIKPPLAEQPEPIPEEPHKAARQAHIERQERAHSVARNLLRRRAKAAPQESEEDGVSEKLRAAVVGVAGIEKALAEVPVLTDLEGLTQALIGEVVDLLTPETAGLYLPGPDGFQVWASHNFSNVERSMVVQTHQPLFADLLVRHEALLIEPLDLAHGLANGVGGARTNAFLASPIEVDGTCIGVIVAGRGHFENEDLDRLEALAEEAALGLAVALGLDRLRHRLD